MTLKLMCLRLLLPVFLFGAALAQANEPAAADKPKAAAPPAAKAATPKADPTKGQALASGVCLACHNADGNSSITANPKLAGQNAEYLYTQLKNFKSVDGKPALRPNAVMTGMVAPLSDEDMRNVAAWYASQTLKGGKAKDNGSVDLGRKLYRAGDLAKGMPACAGCHGPTGSGVPVQYPRIGGQHADYLEAQLKTFRTGERANASMHIVALKMTDAEIKAVANYIAGLR